MKIVPLNRLLIQPTVQCKWIEQHKTIEFLLDENMQRLFASVWQAYLAFSCQELVLFLDSDVGRSYELHNHDILFALLAGADFIYHKYPQFQIAFQQPNLTWSIA